MKSKFSKELYDLYDLLKRGIKTQKQFMGKVKYNEHLINEVINLTWFLDEYLVDDLNERLYYVMNDLDEVVKCPYCGDKANFKNTVDGYRQTCKNKTCIAKMRAEINTGNTKISENREKKFKDWEKTITSPSQLNDDVIKQNIVADKYLQQLTNKIILDYLNNRLPDSYSLWETWHRIVHDRTEPKPICARPGCNNPVVYRGRKEHTYTYYCSDSCKANSPETHQKAKETQLKNWGNECCFKSEKFQQKIINETGHAYLFQTDDFKQKRSDASMKHFGTEHPSQNPEIAQKISKTLQSTPRPQRSGSKEEDALADALTMMEFAYIREFKSKLYPWHADFTILNYNKVFVIEYQGGKFHNFHPYNPKDEFDIEEARLLKEKAVAYEEKTGIKYNMLQQRHYTWTVRDVLKRNVAKANGVLLLEIYPYETAEELVSRIKRFIDKHGLYRDDSKTKLFMDNIVEYRYEYDVDDGSQDDCNPTDVDSLDDENLNLTMLIRRKRKRGEKLSSDDVLFLCEQMEEKNFDEDYNIIELEY